MRTIVIALALACSAACGAQRAYTLDECVAMARQHNRSLASAALDISTADEQLGGAKANRLPQVSATVMAFQAFDKIVKADGLLPQELAALGEVNPAFAQMAGQPFSLHELNSGYGATLTAMLPLYTGGKITAGVGLAGVQADVARLQMQMKEKDVVQKVTENFWNTCAQRYALRTIAAAERQLDTVCHQVELFVKAGVTTRNALLQVHLRQQELASQRLQLDNGCRLLLMLLAQQTGADPQTFDISVPEGDTLAPMPDGSGRGLAPAEREEYKLAAQSVRAEELQVKMAKADQRPSVAVGLMGYHTGLGGLSDQAKNYAPSKMTDALALATVSIPISEWWGPAKHSVRQHKHALAKAQNDLADTREQLAVDVESAWLKLTEARQQIDLARASVAEADENYRMSREQYRMGTETISDLLDAETLRRKAADGLSANIAAYNIRLADYLRKTGK